MNTNHGVYVEHPKRAMIEGLAFEHGCDHTVTKCSGQWYMFPSKEQAIEFLWRIRNMTARYVEVEADLGAELKKFVRKQGFSGDLTGLVSKILEPAKETDPKPGTWEDNNTQFARMLAELNAAGAPNRTQLKLLKESMDLSTEEINEIFDRAEVAWQEIKETLR